MNATWTLTEPAPAAEESIPTFICVDCDRPITVKQYKHTDEEGHHHLLAMDCPALVHDADCSCDDCDRGDFDPQQESYPSRA